MSKMACRCGNIISDTLVPCPTEGWILRCQNEEEFQNTASRNITAFFQATHAGQRKEWIEQFFDPQYSAEQSNEEIVNDILCHSLYDDSLLISECEQCGRLWVQQAPEVNRYRSFSPDEGRYSGVLRAKP